MQSVLSWANLFLNVEQFHTLTLTFHIFILHTLLVQLWLLEANLGDKVCRINL